MATPAFLRDHFRLPPSSRHSPLDPLTLHPSLSNRSHVQLLLRYCLHDMSDTSPASLLSSLHLLPFLPTASGAIRPLVLYTHTEGTQLLTNT